MQLANSMEGPGEMVAKMVFVRIFLLSNEPWTWVTASSSVKATMDLEILVVTLEYVNHLQCDKF